VCAVTDCVAYEITDDHVAELFSKRPLLVDEISRVMAERCLHNDEALVHLSAEKLNAHKATLAEQFTMKIRAFFNRVFTESA
jgi:CRP-like cAMP-binding protein